MENSMVKEFLSAQLNNLKRESGKMEKESNGLNYKTIIFLYKIKY